MRSEPHFERPVASRDTRWLVRLIMLFYAALLAEGVLRKWVVPGFSNGLVFLRDPLMVLILLAYARCGPTPSMRRALTGLALVLLGFVLCGALQALTTDVSGLVLLAGLRNYLFFVPLCFAIRDAFTAADYQRWLKLNLVIAVPMAALVLLQYRAAPTAPINAVPGGGSDGVFLLVEEVVRPYGVFSFALGHSAFSAWMVGVALAAWTGRRQGDPGWPLLVSGSTAIALMGVLSGSRTYFVFAGSAVAVFAAMALLVGPPRAKVLGVAATVGLLGAALAALLFVPSLADNLLARQEAATAIEGSTLDRLTQVLTDFTGELGRVPVFGYGIGAGTNIANFLANGRTDHVLAEYELTRIVQELGPVFGVAAILLRWGFVAVLAGMAARAAQRGNLQPACHLGFLVPVFLAHDITLQNTMIGIGWFAAGMALSAARVGRPSVTATPVPARALAGHEVRP